MGAGKQVLPLPDESLSPFNSVADPRGSSTDGTIEKSSSLIVAIMGSLRPRLANSLTAVGDPPPPRARVNLARSLIPQIPIGGTPPRIYPRIPGHTPYDAHPRLVSIFHQPPQFPLAWSCQAILHREGTPLNNSVDSRSFDLVVDAPCQD